MTTPGASLTTRPSWKALEAHHAKVREVHMRTLFSDDPQRSSRLTVQGAGLFLDYSKHRITDDTIRLLLQLAEEVKLAVAHRGDVPRGKNQCDGTASCSARGSPRS